MEVHIIAQWRLHLLKKTTSEFTITEYPRGSRNMGRTHGDRNRTPLEAMAGRAHEGHMHSQEIKCQ
ncbi:hypothetical protein C4D60_Mb08t23770 [Musa balbisiana]|uniref:Uncharacterized protein n=1 Tax=Musa balbisiana TaxID=52838 RepID=A0A4S8K606_MUSBA|nr:hypothetical protein C4D60_Mb08t23770 [Musa balbisiana]